MLGAATTYGGHNAFGQHKIPWNHKDLEHTSMGVLWWAGGTLGLILSRGNRRSVVPALIIAGTGYGMAAHGQSTEFSTTIHRFFGFSLGAAGLARIIEICFVLRDQPSSATEGPRVWQHLTPFFLTLGGVTFMNGAEQEMTWVNESVMDTTTFINGLAAEAFVVYAMAVALVELFEYLSKPRETLDDRERDGGAEGWLQMAAGQLPAFLGSSRAQRVFPRRGGATDAEGYEAVPLTATGSTPPPLRPDADALERERADSAATVFEVGDEEEDDGGDDYWVEKEPKTRQ